MANEESPRYGAAYLMRATRVDANSRVETIYLGRDRSLSNNGPPILYETRVIGGKLDGLFERYTTNERAMEGHRNLVARLVLEM